VDLAFTDGTYLSDLGAIDQHGFPLSPRGQGASKALYVNQWNDVASRIGSVAAGKTVDRILVAYDSPDGPAKFRGWIDDVALRQVAPQKPKAHLSDYALTTRGTNSSGSFSPRLRSRAQCVSRNVGYDASQIMPQCAPPSDSPITPAGWVIISRIASQLPWL